MSIPVRSLGQLTINKPGFLASIDQKGSDSLYISSFQLLGGDSVSRLDNLADVVKSGSIANAPTTKTGGSITWPNDATPVPSDLLGTDGIIVGGGFLVPGKGNGGLFFSPTGANGASGNWVKLGGTKKDWLYHRVLFADIDMDGKDEIVTCRARVPVIGNRETMLVYLKPASKPTGTWNEVEIGTGCDALFTVVDLNGDGIPEILTPSFFTSVFNLFTSTNKSAGFSDPGSVKNVLLDNTIGAAFDVEYVDINNDGKKDLLVTNHQGSGAAPIPAVCAYEIPADITDAKGYVRHTLADGFPVTQWGLNQASPGSPVAFHPTEASKSGPPYIALAGDAAQIAYVLVPGEKEWEYKTTTLTNCGCTVGAWLSRMSMGTGMLKSSCLAMTTTRSRASRLLRELVGVNHDDA
jgi:hypothetical protein